MTGTGERNANGKVHSVGWPGLIEKYHSILVQLVPIGPTGQPVKMGITRGFALL